MDAIEEILFGPFFIFGEFPPLVFFVACMFFFLYFKKKHILILLAAVLWLLYALWESYITYIYASTVSNILRFDFLLLPPLLYLFSALGVWKYFSMKSQRAARKK